MHWRKTTCWILAGTATTAGARALLARLQRLQPARCASRYELVRQKTAGAGAICFTTGSVPATPAGARAMYSTTSAGRVSSQLRTALKANTTTGARGADDGGGAASSSELLQVPCSTSACGALMIQREAFSSCSTPHQLLRQA